MSFNDVGRARQIFFQSLYKMHMTKLNLKDIAEEFTEENKDKKYDREYLYDLISKYSDYSEQIEALLEKILKNRSCAQISPVELSVCRLGVYELLFKSNIPYKVVITEALKIQQKYGEEEGYRLVNGILDQASKMIRNSDENDK